MNSQGLFFNIAGSVNTLFVLGSLIGVTAQLRKIRNRKKDADLVSARRVTSVLSLNQFLVSYLGYFSFFVYGYSVQPFNHYMVWPRMLACSLLLTILYEILAERRNRLSRSAFIFACVLAVAGVTGLIWGERYNDESRGVATIIIVTVALLMAQGWTHQIIKVWHQGQTGAVSLLMSQMILIMDISTIVFAFSMGLDKGWPLLFLAVVSAATKLAIMWLFRWEHNSPLAARRRDARSAIHN